MKKIEKLKENESIRSALKKVSGFFGKIACVVDKKNKLLGIVTAGDLRRAILSGHDPKDKIESIYNKKFIFIYQNELKTKNFFKSNFSNIEINDAIFYIPIVNDKDQVVNILPTERVIEIIESKTKIGSKNKLNLPKVLVVGGAGYIGSNLCLKLLKKKYDVTAVDKLLYDKEVVKKYLNKFKNFKFIKADICDLNVQINIIKDIDVVVFLAEIVGDPACNAMPEDALKTNYLSISSMAQLCSHLNISKFIYTSSCSVYGLNKNNNLLKEISNLNPLSHYARMKIMSEKALLKNKNEIFQPTILRLGTVFGPSLRNRFDLVVNTMAKNAHYENKISVHGGNQWRPNIHVDDVADGIIAVIQAKQSKVGNKIFNLSSDKSNHMISQLAVGAKKIFKNAKIQVKKKLIDSRIIEYLQNFYINKQDLELQKIFCMHIKDLRNYLILTKILILKKKFLATSKS